MTPMQVATLALALLVAAPGAGTPPVRDAAPAGRTEDPFPPALAIDGAPVPGVDFASWLVELQGGHHLREFVDEWLVEREARRAGVELPPGTVEAAVLTEVQERIDAAFGGERAAWVAELQQLGTSVEAHLAERRLEARQRLLIDALVRARRVVTEEEVRAAWEDRHGPAGRALFAARLLVRVRVPDGEEGLSREESQARVRAAQEQALARAKALHARVLAGEDFGALVREASEDHQTRREGGRLPDPIVPADWPQADLEALRAWRVGEVLPPFLGGGGYNLMRLERAVETPLAEVEEELRRALLAAPADQLERFELREELRTGAIVELLPEVRREVSVDAPRLDRAVALVDGEGLLRRDLARWLVPRHGRPFLRTFMEHRELERLAAEAGLEPDPVTVEQRVQADLERQVQLFHRGDRERWLAELAANGRSLEDFLQVARIRTRHTLRAEALLLKDRVVSDADVRREWEIRYGEGGRSLDVRLLLRRIPEPEPGSVSTNEELAAYLARERAAAIELLEGLAGRVRDGEDFGALVRTYSQDPLTRDRGGRGEGRFGLHTWPEEVQRRLRALEPGQVAGPLEVGGELLLFELAGRVLVPLEEVADGLRAELEVRPPTQVEVAGFINSLTRRIEVESRLDAWR